MLPKDPPAQGLPANEKGLAAMAGITLTALPLELVTKVLEELDWYSLMNVRKTCKYLANISKLLSVWRSQLQRYLSRHRYTPRLESPLAAFSASDLERWVTQRISADAGWKSSNTTKPTRTRYIRDHTASGVCLVPGGRWLLVGSDDGSVAAYDLDRDSATLDDDGRFLFQLPDRREVNYICVDVDEDAPSLAFNVALSPAWQDADSEKALSIHVWRVSLVGHGRKAYLTASPLRSFEAHVTAEIACLTLHQHLLGRLILTSDRMFRIEVFDWTKSTTSLHCKTVISSGEHLDAIRLLPGKRLLAFSESFLTIYEVAPVVHKDDSLPSAPSHPVEVEPRWKLPCALRDRTRRGGISPAFTDAHATYFSFVAGSAVHGLVIPHNTQHPPRTLELARFAEAPRFPDLALGFEKMFAHHHREAAVRLGFAWKEERRLGVREGDDGYAVEACEYSREWNVVCPPVLDEGSGRIVQALINGVLVMDTALCCSVIPHADEKV
ncbi:hypothetical protein LshimejAT787_0210820 [Lyophyllum shimeji]|uniref:F-box domain-containing protein n=1 Tax=Lyophyllum shimeji TaxID=47721 RepID=A0A9P3UJJ7_LYOSH|nr:hypothetical protein LshimejAT787_0210820 [Lyophyllum shimeji]